jgi:hypothetical protein
VPTRLFDDGWRDGVTSQLSWAVPVGLFEGAEMIIAEQSEILPGSSECRLTT